MKELTLSLLESDSCKYLVQALELELAPLFLLSQGYLSLVWSLR